MQSVLCSSDTGTERNFVDICEKYVPQTIVPYGRYIHLRQTNKTVCSTNVMTTAPNTSLHKSVSILLLQEGGD